MTFAVLQMANGTMGKTQQIDNTTMLGHMNHSLVKQVQAVPDLILSGIFLCPKKDEIDSKKLLYGVN